MTWTDRVVVNVDDPRGASLAETAGRPVTYAINRDADVTPGPLNFALDGLAFDVKTPQGVPAGTPCDALQSRVVRFTCR